MAKKTEVSNVMPDGTPIDLDSIDFGDNNFTKRQKLFIFWFTMPFQETYKDWTKSAQKAGYSQKSSHKAKFNLFENNPNVQKIIDEMLARNKKIGLKAAAEYLINQKYKRATYNVKDYYEDIEITNPETGDSITKTMLRPISELSREEASIIDNVEINQSGIATYKMPNKEKESNELIKYAAEENRDNLGDGYDVETTVEMVKEQLATVKTTIRVNNQKIRENAENYIENSENLPEFD